MRGSFLVVMTLFLAGCADGGGGEEAEPEAFQEIGDVASDKGLILGVVVNQDIVPVEGAIVTLLASGDATTTDEEGAFIFEDLEPGTYFMETTAPAHNTVQSSVEVEAGKRPPAHQIRLIFTPPPVPHVEEIPWNFFMDASANANGNRVVLGNFLGSGTFGATLEFEANVTWVQSELTWDYAQPLAERMRMQTNVQEAGNGVANCVAQSASPAICSFGSDPDVNISNVTAAGYTLYVAPGELAPVGATIGQELTLFLHVFHGFEPREGWQFGADGAHPIP